MSCLPAAALQGLVFADGDHWAEQRRFALKHMKTFGFGKTGHQGVIQEEVRLGRSMQATGFFQVEELIQMLSRQEGEDFLMHTEFAIPTINILWIIVASKRFRHDDPDTLSLIKLITRSLVASL